MKQKAKLSTSMTLAQFDNGYWYTTELKEFAETIGIPSANKLRKDELEKAVQLFLKNRRDQNHQRNGSPEAGSWIEKEIWCTLSSDSVTKMCT